MAGLLYPAFQKLYSALSSLDRFDKEANFFDNIACIDNFFAEYRNVTFAIQAQIKHTKHFAAYERLRDQYLVDHWFVDKRNETTKQQPFRLVKCLRLDIYFPDQGFPLFEKEFSVENDTPLESLYPNLRKLFLSLKESEVFFSAEYYFHEDGSEIDLFDKLITGVSSMLQFMSALEQDIGEECELCNQIKDKIRKLNFPAITREFLLVTDYVYYPIDDRFERGGKVSLQMQDAQHKELNRIPLAGITQSEFFNYDGTVFGNFSFMHAIMRCVQPGMEIMSALLVVYQDATYDIDIFHADIKTTVYRKINDVATTIREQNVTEVCFVCLYATLPVSEDIPLTSKERVALSTSDVLVCASIDNRLKEKEYVFDGKAMEHPEYVVHTMKNGLMTSLDASRTNLFPIWRAFKEKMTTII